MNCKTCKHRSVPEGYNDPEWVTTYKARDELSLEWSVCAYVTGPASSLNPSAAAYVRDGSDYAAYLIVRDDFGCIHWEEA